VDDSKKEVRSLSNEINIVKFLMIYSSFLCISGIMPIRCVKMKDRRLVDSKTINSKRYDHNNNRLRCLFRVNDSTEKARSQDAVLAAIFNTLRAMTGKCG